MFASVDGLTCSAADMIDGATGSAIKVTGDLVSPLTIGPNRCVLKKESNLGGIAPLSPRHPGSICASSFRM